MLWQRSLEIKFLLEVVNYKFFISKYNWENIYNEKIFNYWRLWLYWSTLNKKTIKEKMYNRYYRLTQKKKILFVPNSLIFSKVIFQIKIFLKN